MIAMDAYFLQLQLDGPLGEDAMFRGQPQRVLVDRARKLVGEYGEVVGHRVMVQIPARLAPVSGDPVALLESSDHWQLDVLDAEKTDASLQAWIVRPA